MRGYKETLHPPLSYLPYSITISARVTYLAVLSTPPSSCLWPSTEYRTTDYTCHSHGSEPDTGAPKGLRYDPCGPESTQLE